MVMCSNRYNGSHLTQRQWDAETVFDKLKTGIISYSILELQYMVQ